VGQQDNEPPPAGAILDLNGLPIPGGGDGVTFQQYSVSFTATLGSTAITFAFRDDPAYISFVNASVIDLTHPNGNILVNGDFSGGVHSQNGDDYVPNGWTFTNPYGADAFGEVQSGCDEYPYCWYDGAVEAYDEISQTIITSVGDTYQITFSLAENSECECNFSDVSGDGYAGIDVTVYAQAGTPFTVANFVGSSDGADPLYMSLVQGSDGNFYGTTVAGGAFDNGTVFQVTPSGTLTTLYSFCSQTNCTDGGEPFSGLVQGSDGNFYGTAYWGGVNGEGTIFKISSTGQLMTVHSFAGSPTEGAHPIAGLIQFGGNFYGTTQFGGANGQGTVFEVTPGGALTTLYSFCPQSGCTDGSQPWAGLVQAGGNFYGTTLGGGANGAGTVFAITPTGHLTSLYSFCSQTNCADGIEPYAGLVQASNGNFFGTTAFGGSSDFCGGCGTIFEITPAGQFTTFYDFCSQESCTDGLAPFAGLIQASDGNFYGTTQDGGTNGYGTVFGITAAGQLTTLYSFGLTDGAYPDGGLLDVSGNLYGTAEFGSIQFDGTIFTLPLGLQPFAKTHPNSRKAGANVIMRRPDVMGARTDGLSGKMRVFPDDSRTRVRPWGPIDSITGTMAVTRPGARALTGQGLSTLLNFDGSNGADPEFMSLIQGNDGNYYGTTESGGAYEQGTVFEITPGGTLTTLYTLCSQTNCTDGAEPEAGLVQGTDGNFYGTSYWGGANGQGTVFVVAPGGGLTTLYSFCSQPGCTDGIYPQAGLVQGADGNFYGTTSAGGASGAGTVFVVTPGGQLTTLYSFGYYPDGGYPEAGLVQGADGNFYGTTNQGGANGYGTVFEMTPAGQLNTLYSFCSLTNCVDGGFPQAGLVQDSNQNFYGTTSYAGANGLNYYGTVFEITTAGQLTTLYSFCTQANCVDGRYPLAGLVQVGGNFYGTTYAGGANHFGTVFEVTPAGQLTTLYSFDLTDGAYPDSGLLPANGNLYGTTVFGGTSLDGTIFSLPLAQQGLTLSCPTGTAQVGVAYSSALTASGGVAPYTFSILSGSLPPGLSLNSSTGAITGTPTTAGTYNFTAQVVDSQSNTATSSCSIVVSAPLTLSCPTGNGQVGIGYSSALTAAGGVAPYTFSIISGSLPPGLTLNTSTGTVIGTPTTAGTYNFTAQVKDSQGNTATASCTITISNPQSCTGTNNGNLVGNYAFLYQGWSNFSGSGYVLTGTAGSLVFDGNGNITSGQYDQNDPIDGPSQGTLTGTYCVPANNLGTVTINGSNGNTTTYAFVLQPNGNGSVIPFDTTTPWDASGIFLKQNTNDFSTSDFTGQYSLGFVGIDNAFSRFGLAGAVTANGTANLTDGELDGDDGGNYFNGTFNSSNFSVTSSGRGTMSLNVSGVGTGNFAFYVVNSSQLLIVQIDPISQGLQTLFTGQVVQQQGLTYSDSDLNGVSVLGYQGLDTSCNPVACPDAQLYFALWNGSGAFSYSGDENDGGTTSSSSGSGTYSVGSNGRVALSGTGNHSPIFYLTGKNAGFAASNGGQEVQFGSMVSQSGSNFNNNSISGNYYGGSWELESPNNCGEVDLVNVNSGNGTVTSDKNCGQSPQSETDSFTYAVSSGGRTVVSQNGVENGILYIISPSNGGSGGSFIFLPSDNTNPTLGSFGVLPTTVTVTCPTGTAQVGVAYSSALTASGGVAPYTFSILSGSLPPGLSLNSSTGAITGTPTTAGTYNFTAQVKDSQGNTATASCSIVVSSGGTLNCPTGTAQVGIAYSSALTATGGVPPYTFSIIAGSLPPGLSLNASTGAITGTPTTVGTYNFTAQVVDSKGNTATASCSIVVLPALTLSCPTGTGQVGVSYSSALTATGGVSPYTFSITIGALPPGLLLNSSTGAITGTPTTAGTYNFTAQVTDSKGNTAIASCSIVVSPPPLTLTCPTGTAQVNVAYSSALLASGGVAPYTFSIIGGSLPPGLSLNSSTGAITGTPTTAGTYNFTAQVVDSKSNTANASCSIVVTPAGTNPTTTSLTLTPSSIPVGSVGPIVMTATVTPLSGSGTPTGTVTYFNGSTQIGTATLSGGVGTFNYNPSSLAVGIYSITAVYSGDSMFSASTSAPQTLGITQTGPFAYVANNSSNTVSVINIPTGQILNNILVGSGPWGTAISPDQTQVYVTNNQGNSVSVINAASGSVVNTIPVQSSPFGVIFTPDGTQAYVVNGSSNTVSVINTATQTVIATVQVQNSPVGVAMAPTSNGTFAYVTNSASNTVSVIAVGSNPTVVQTIPVGTGPRWVTVSPNSMWAYVENAGSNNVSVISVATNKVTATIPVGTSPFGAAFTPDNSTVYVANSGSNNVSVIDTKSNTVIGTVAGFNNPVQVALTMDGASAYVTNLNANTVSVIATASNTIAGTVGVGNGPTGVAIASAPQVVLQITQPLSPTQQNNFNFGSNTYAVQYPPGTQFSNVNMTVTAVEITQAQFQQRVAGTKFANASCIVYGGGAGNCIDDQVTCSDGNGNPIACPSEPQPTIAVQTSFTTSQAIVNPGYLTTPIGQNMWQNIFSGFSDPTVKGKTQGFSEFIAVDLGANGPQGAAHFELLKPRLPRKYEHGELIPIVFRLTSVANGKPVTHAKAGLSVVMVADAKGNPTQKVVFERTTAFKQIAPGKYQHILSAGKYAAGTYAMTIYGDAFPAFQGQFKILH
jgi:YVTN family beta-propeller protein/uncharacterized repeat protein (TIGR03803 family)